MKIKKSRIHKIIVSLVIVPITIITFSKAASAWTQIGEGYYDTFAYINTYLVTSYNDVELTVKDDPIPAWGECAESGTIHFPDPDSNPMFKALFATVVTAHITKTPVYVSVNCGENGNYLLRGVGPQ